MDENRPAPELDAADIDELRARLSEAEETLRAIRCGEVDALLVVDDSGERVYTLRSADAPYRAFVEQMQEGAVAVNAGGDVMYCNRRFAELAATPQEHVVGASIDRFLDSDDATVLKAMIADGTGKLRTRLRRGRKPIEVQISISTVTLDGDEHRTLIVTDISTLTKVQRESQAKDEFLAMLAHELRNPLGAIGGAVQVLSLADLREPRAIRARDIIERQMRHMARLVDDLLDVGRVVTGKISLDRRPLDLGESVKSYVAAITSVPKAEGHIDLSAESVWVRGDAVRLEQIVGNLVSNALKFTPPDRRVRVSVTAEGGDAVLRVTDQGIGIDADLLPRIFDLFVQAEDTMDRAKGGLGIGLTLVRRLAELHGGSVEAESEGGGKGATFTVRLPAVPASVSETTGVQPGPRRPSRRVLLVDDNADAREMYCLVLQADGHEVHEAHDGAAALTAFRCAKPDVAVIDIGLPGIDGYELARLIRAEPDGHDVTLIALTGYGFPEDRERSRAAGFDRHLVKPAAPEDLRRVLVEPAQRVQTDA
jgi:two-component system, sensor histidine kinase